MADRKSQDVDRMATTDASASIGGETTDVAAQPVDLVSGEEDHRVLRKIDWHLQPVIMVVSAIIWPTSRIHL